MSDSAELDVLDQIGRAAAAVSARVSDTTVAVGRNGRGSGVVVGPDRVLTNAHNLRDRTTQVTFSDGRAAQGKVAAADPHGDLAVLEVDTGEVSPIEWAGEDATTGEVVFAVARGVRSARVSMGLVSGTGRTFRGPGGRPIWGSVEHTAPMARGSSGGPLVDRHGRLVGLNTHRIGDGFYLALAADEELRARVEALSRGEAPSRLLLGVSLASAQVARRLRRSVGLPERDGLLVRAVEAGSPGDEAGVREGDLLVVAGGVDLGVPDDLFGVLARHDAAAPLGIDLVRGSDDLSVTVTFPTTDAGVGS